MHFFLLNYNKQLHFFHETNYVILAHFNLNAKKSKWAIFIEFLDV